MNAKSKPEPVRSDLLLFIRGGAFYVGIESYSIKEIQIYRRKWPQ